MVRFDVVAGVLQGDTFATKFVYNLHTLRNSNIIRSNKRKWLHVKKKKNKKLLQTQTTQMI